MSNTLVSRRKDKSVYAKTTAEVTVHGTAALLTIETGKHLSGGLCTTAQIGWPTGHGSIVTRLGISMNSANDFRQTTRDPTARCTEKNVTAMHTKALSHIDATSACAVAHYPTPESIYKP